MSALNPIYVVVTNANVLINLIHIDRLDLLGALASYEFVVPPEVEAEIRVPDYSRALARAFDADHIRRRAFTSTDELVLYAEHTHVIGRGEAACLAMAEVQGWYVASDEQHKFLQLVKARLGTGHILNTLGLFELAIRANVITTEEADEDKLVLAELKRQLSSFRKLAAPRLMPVDLYKSFETGVAKADAIGG